MTATTEKTVNKNQKNRKNKKEPPPDPAREVVVIKNFENSKFGDLETIQSQQKSNRKWIEIKEIEENLGKQIWIRARIHRVRKKSNKMAFFLFRGEMHTVQGILIQNEEIKITTEMVKYCSKVPPESVVDVLASVNKAEMPIKGATFHQIELLIEKLFVVSASLPSLPFQLDIASNKFSENTDSDKAIISVQRALRVDYRFIDLRTDVNFAIFRIQSAVCSYFREFLQRNGFIEIHTPKIVPGVSEGGAEVFKLDYFEKKACLAQSPQLYKQMAISSDLGPVFEIGPVFRAENANTHRHLTEFVGLDLEMPINEHYSEILDLTGDLFVFIFDKLNENQSKEIETVRRSYPFEDLVYPKKTVTILFDEATSMIAAEKEILISEGKTEKELKDLGAVMDPLSDFSTANEKMLGRLMKRKYNTDFYFVHRYPISIRPFYTMPAYDDNKYTNSYDFFLRGEEITSGAQRVHDPDLLTQRAIECGICLDSLKSYIDSFRFGIRPHGGIGVGLERVVMLFLGLYNIRECSLFPRDPKRLSP